MMALPTKPYPRTAAVPSVASGHRLNDARRAIQTSFWLLVATTLTHAAERPPVPTLVPTSAATPPVIDGRLDDACWQATEPVSRFWNVEGTERFGELQWVKVASDEEAIYIGYHMKADPQSELPTGSKLRDEGVWFSPNIQVFVQPPGTGSYYIFTLNSRNTQEDSKDYDSLWNCTWQSAVFIAKDKSYWQAEIDSRSAVGPCPDSIRRR